MSGATAGSHSLAFRVMRLCRPSFHVETPLLVNPNDLFFGEDLHDDLSLSSRLNDLTSSLFHDSDSDLSYNSNFEVRDVTIKAEIQTERQRILLLDTSKSPVESIRAGGRYDFIVEHDVKELGGHTLVCTALYSDGEGERKYLPQFFKFNVSNPLSVRTKVRVVKETTFLEACIENHTKSNLFMDQVEFEPAQHWTVTTLKADEHSSENNTLSREIFKPPIIIRSGGGIQNYLYQLKSSAQGSTHTKLEGSIVLGKLQITWRANLGEPGRLQTQQILGSPILRKEIELQVAVVPSVIIFERPFLVQLNLINQTDRTLGPFEVRLSQSDSMEKAVMVNGLQKMAVPQVDAFASTKFHVNLIATKLGVQKVTGFMVFDMHEKRAYDLSPDLEIFVGSDVAHQVGEQQPA
ncbi:Trafficking protein particle complex subunit 13 [Dillenia turbinata]|uniref:Trafficking protein particle complex subunit 13 n=1 Tax=Dillenia turbinata TaxID=194707 RepID=A0AAN8VMF7_9MAGN